MPVPTRADSFPIDSRRLPSLPGIYILFAPEEAASELGITRGSEGAIYVGKAEDSIEKRIQRAHLLDGQSGRSTLRRSIGALLRAAQELEPRPRSQAGGEIRFQNDAFDQPGERRLSVWIRSALTVAALPTNDPATTEKDLIAALRPPLNLTGWPNPSGKDIRGARKVCADMARRYQA